MRRKKAPERQKEKRLADQIVRWVAIRGGTRSRCQILNHSSFESNLLVADSPNQIWTPMNARSVIPNTVKRAMIRPLSQAYIVPPHFSVSAIVRKMLRVSQTWRANNTQIILGTNIAKPRGSRFHRIPRKLFLSLVLSPEESFRKNMIMNAVTPLSSC